MRKPAVLLGLLLISLIQSCSPSIKTQCKRVVSANEWMYANLKQGRTMRINNTEQAENFYTAQIAQSKILAKEASKHMKSLNIEYSDKTLGAAASNAARTINLISGYHENVLRVMEFYEKSEQGVPQDDSEVQEVRIKALEQEDYLSNVNKQNLELEDLNRVKDYCSQK